MGPLYSMALCIGRWKDRMLKLSTFDLHLTFSSFLELKFVIIQSSTHHFSPPKHCFPFNFCSFFQLQFQYVSRSYICEFHDWINYASNSNFEFISLVENFTWGYGTKLSLKPYLTKFRILMKLLILVQILSITVQRNK